MAGPPTASFAEIRWQYSGPGLPGGRAQHALGVLNGAAPETLATNAVLAWEDWRRYVSIGVRLDQVSVKRGPVDTGPTHVLPVSQAGSDPGENTPQLAVLVTKRVAGVSGRFGGRMFLPGFSEAQVAAGGVLVTATLGGLQSIMDDLYAALVVDGSTPQVFPASGSSDAREVVSLPVEGVVATQRRRLRR